MSINATGVFEAIVFSVYFSINQVHLNEYNILVFKLSLCSKCNLFLFG